MNKEIQLDILRSNLETTSEAARLAIRHAEEYPSDVNIVKQKNKLISQRRSLIKQIQDLDNESS